MLIFIQNYWKYRTKTLIFIWIGSFILSPTLSFAQQNKILVCLGREESALHKAKDTGPLYRLNQKLIGQLTGSNQVDIRAEYLKKICQKSAFGPSVSFLKISLLHGIKIFSFPKNVKSSIRTYQIKSFESFLERLPHLFFGYLMSLQALAPRARCLETHIPELAIIFERYKYLEIDHSINDLIVDKKNITKIFDKLIKLDQIFAECARPPKKRKEKKTTK